MANNELTLLDAIIRDSQAERDVALPDDEAFELFSASQVLRQYELSDDEITDGIVDGGNDGGIDAAYAFLDGSLIAEDSEVLDDAVAPIKFAKSQPLDIVFVQSKRGTSFQEVALTKAQTTLKHLLDLQTPESDLRKLYNTALVTKALQYRTALTKLASRHPRLRVKFLYITRGSTTAVDKKVRTRAGHLQDELLKLLPGSSAEVGLIGAKELWASASTQPSYTLPLTWEESINSTDGYTALISLNDYLSFIAEKDGTIRRHIFDWNVRDFQGKIEVNKEISQSLLDKDASDFWWLNNGVTVVCSQVTTVGKTFQLEDVQVVNGLQTSFTIADSLLALDADDERRKRRLLVRILITEDKATRDRIIRATNRQTTVSTASLRATDDIQREIERYLATKGWFYDRRKNYYKNIGKNPARIVGIPYLAQAIMSIGLSEPDTARARPSTLLKRDQDYERVFSRSVPLEVYFWILRVRRSVDDYLNSAGATVTPQEKTNLRFHLATLATARLAGGMVANPSQLKKLAAAEKMPTNAQLKACMNELRGWLKEFTTERPDEDYDKIAKGSDFVEFMKSKVSGIE